MSELVEATALTAATIESNVAVDIRPLIMSVFNVRTSCSGLLARGCSEEKSRDVPVGAKFALTAILENTMVFTKFARLIAVDVLRVPNSGPLSPPGMPVEGEK